MTRYEELKHKENIARKNGHYAETSWAMLYWFAVADKLKEEAEALTLKDATN